MWKFKGFFIQKKSLRDYRINHSANVLGYVSEVNQHDLKRDDYYRLGEIIGRQGVEKSYERQLRGVKGKRFLQKYGLIESWGRIKGKLISPLFLPKYPFNARC